MLGGMYDGYADASPVHLREPLVRTDFGTAGWNELHGLAALYGRKPRQQVLALLRWAVWRSLQGDDTELTRAQLNELLGSIEPLELVS